MDQIDLPITISASLRVAERGGVMMLFVKGQAAHHYDLFRSMDLRSWQKETTLKLDLKGEAAINLGPASKSRFYKINSR